MSFAGHQDVWATGSRVFFQRDPININGVLTPQPPLDLGIVDTVSPDNTVNSFFVEDGDGGMIETLGEIVTQVRESYVATLKNFNPDNKAMLWDALPPKAFTQANTSITASHRLVPNRLVKLLDALGEPIYGVADVTSVGDGQGGTLVEGVDFEFLYPERGFIRLIGNRLQSPVTAPISFVPRAISGDNRLILPQTNACTVTGFMMLFYGRCRNAKQDVREARVTIKPEGASLSLTEMSTMQLRFTVMTDPTKPMRAGRLLYWLGDLPPKS